MPNNVGQLWSNELKQVGGVMCKAPYNVTKLTLIGYRYTFQNTPSVFNVLRKDVQCFSPTCFCLLICLKWAVFYLLCYMAYAKLLFKISNF